MPAPRFVHLRLHTEYSIVDGTARVADVVNAALADAMPALAITDAGNLFGAVKFFLAARAKGVQPIIGCDLAITNERNRDQPHRIAVLVRSREGYRSLCELLTRAFSENQWRGRAEVRREWMKGTEGLIVLSGAEAGDVGAALVSDAPELAETLARAWADDLPGAYYLELQRVDPAGNEPHVRAAVALADRLGLPVVATHPIQFVKPDEFTAHEARVCITQGYVLGDPRRPRDFRPTQYFKSQAEMAELFADLPEALENSVEIARRTAFEFSLGEPRLPDFPTPRGESIADFLRAEAMRGLHARLAADFPDEGEREARRPGYVERLDYEVKTIVQMGYPGYFLIVADFIGWAKANGIPVGPGRGSGAGSLVAYSLGITGLDPLRYELLFERFLNPERVSMPDFDIDFCQDGRDRVIDYVRSKYGAHSVAQIATFGTMAAKAVVRDVGRVLGMGFLEVDRIAKLIPFDLGITLDKAIEAEPQLKQVIEEQEEVRELVQLARSLEGLTRNVGMHAGGVIIAPGRITDFTPLYCAEGSASTVSQFDKDDVEKTGLVKFDFLGLTTLTIIADCERHVRAMGEPQFDIQAIPLDDPATYKIFSSGNTVAIFQFESRGMRDLIVRARPDRMEDLIALNALYRPGPMDLIPEFIERKHGRARWDYLDPRLKDILDPTYGVMTYQEHVMTIAQVIGGYTLGRADVLRKAMGKKKPEEMAKERQTFLEGAAARGLEERKANILFDHMEKFAGYGFNKSHSAAYALVAYQTAYLKAHFPAAFCAANLSAVMNDTDKVQAIFDDARQNGIEVLSPDVNAGGYRFEPLDERRVRYGLGAVKGTGEHAIDSIVKAREKGGAFRDLGDFCRRVDRRVVNRRAMEALIKAGAFDSVETNRASLAASLGAALDMAEKAERFAQQSSLFGGAEETAAEAFELMRVADWPERERLLAEKQSLGFYLSGHPFSEWRDELRRVARTPLANLQPANEPQMAAGVIYGVAMRNSRRGRIAVLTLDDASARIEVVVYGELFREKRAAIQEDQVVVVQGRVSQDEFSGGLRFIADKLMDLTEIRSLYARGIRLSINGQADGTKLRALLAPYTGGNCPVAIHYRNALGECDIRLPDEYRVKVSGPLIASLADWLSPRNVEVVY